VSRPAGVEWPDTLTGVPHGSPLLVSGRLQGALRDASWRSSPDTAKPKYAHIVVASHRLGMRAGGMLAEAATCDPARIMLFVDGSCKDAAAFPEGVRSRRQACAALFALADNDAADVIATEPGQ
jgi:hypothetical protein